MFHHPDGTWAKNRNDASREMLKNQSGGELTTQGVEGKVCDEDTVTLDNDPGGQRDDVHT